MAWKWWTLTAVCAGVFMLLLDVTIVSVALPAIERGFSAPLSTLEWVISAYALTLAAFLLTAGSLADRFGRRRMFAIGLAAFTFTCALAALVFGLINSGVDGWSAVSVIAPLAAAAALLTVFVLIEARRDAPMLDLHLLRLPAFDGGLVAAFAISASIFSLLIYLVLYLQNYLGLSPLGAGLRVLPLSLAMFASAGVAGRLTVRLPRRFLIGAGFALVGAGLLLMSGLTTSSGWTHLLPGMIVAGLGAGLVNVPLASTAVGVVEPARAGVASGVNSTFRQVGIAAGVAALGSIFAASIQSAVALRLIGTALGSRASQLAHAVSRGGAASAIASTPAPLRGLIVAAGRSAFVSGLDLIMVVGAVVAFAGSIGSLALIRERDFVATATAETVEELIEVAS
jgi:predicted MFS family arabinose efflux permease